MAIFTKQKEKLGEFILLIVLFTSFSAFCQNVEQKNALKPNIIFILSDDLGYGDIGFFGQKKILTPTLNKMANEGMVFTQHYAGAPVCGPSRACLMTGLHQGHGYIKGNPGGVPEREQLRKEDTTVTELLQNAGYETACIGKWGLGQPGTSGYPLNKGFDYFVGYDTHVAAHNYYPESLHKNNGKLTLKNGEYSHDVFTREAIDFLNKKHDKPFFLYLAYTIPHGPFNPPDITPYEAKDWPDKFKKYAAMITRMDRDIGKILQALATNGLDKNTLVIFTSDNGPQSSYGQGPDSMTEFFDSNGPLRGIKRDVLEGGIRVPYIAWWPGEIKPGTSDVPTAFQDFLPTACDLIGIKPPKNIDGISMAPLLFGNNEMFEGHEMMYWEFIRMGGKTTGSRQGALDARNNIKAVRYGTKGEIELYFLNDDLSEKNNVAQQHSAISKQMKAYMDSVRTPSKLWPIPEEGWVVPEEKPNIVLILADDLGWKDTGFQGSEIYETPNLDKLASNGVVFTQAYMTPTCSPSRACLMSGMYPPATGIYSVDAFAGTPEDMKKLETIRSQRILKDEITTIAEMLKPEGYQCATIGKWHLGEDPLTQGFDYNVAGSLVGSPADYFYPYKGKNNSSHDIDIDAGEEGEYLTERLTEEAIKMIEKMKDNPFFLYLPYYSVHVPLQAPQDKIAYFSTKKEGQQFNAVYAAMISSLDEGVGKVMKAIEENGLADNTIVIFVSDNGGQKMCTSNEPLRGQKGNIYEGGIRVPMVVKVPGSTQKNSVCEVPVTVVDFFPTLAELVNSQQHFEKLDGLSLVPLLKGEKPKKFQDRPIFWHLPGYNGNGKANANIWQPPCSAIRQGDWKLIEFFEDNHLELYNLKEDIGETRNLAAAYPSKSQELLNRLKNWQKTSNAPIPVKKQE